MKDNARPPVLQINTQERISTGLSENAELWMSGNFAAAWFREAQKQIDLDADADEMAKPREIIFAVCAIESYLLEWVRDQVLNGNFQRLKDYFPIGSYRPIDERWKAVIVDLHKDGLINGKPNFGEKYWEDFQDLLKFRNGLLHGRASRPDSDSIPTVEKPGPTNAELLEMNQGWAVNTVVEVIRMLHAAVGTAPPVFTPR